MADLARFSVIEILPVGKVPALELDLAHFVVVVK